MNNSPTKSMSKTTYFKKYCSGALFSRICFVSFDPWLNILSLARVMMLASLIFLWRLQSLSSRVPLAALWLRRNSATARLVPNGTALFSCASQATTSPSNITSTSCLAMAARSAGPRAGLYSGL